MRTSRLAMVDALLGSVARLFGEVPANVMEINEALGLIGGRAHRRQGRECGRFTAIGRRFGRSTRTREHGSPPCDPRSPTFCEPFRSYGPTWRAGRSARQRDSRRRQARAPITADAPAVDTRRINLTTR